MKKIPVCLIVFISLIAGIAYAGIDATYVDVWHYESPQLYLFSGNQYTRYDIIPNKSMGTNTISRGYPAVPFSKIDAAYVDIWHYKTPQLYVFSGNQYARYDILSNTLMGINTISRGYP